MNFGSTTYFAFLLIVFVAYWHLPRRHQNLFLLLVSWFFYAFWDWRFLSLVLIATVGNFVCGLLIHHGRDATRRKGWLILGVMFNIGLLGYFKYANFFLDSFISMVNALGWHASSVTLQITLPVGISFYVFQSLTYPLDIYNGKLQPTKSFIEFATFVAFFPKLVAGPITRAREFLFQLEEDRIFRGEDFQDGCIRLLTGFFKKAFIADTLARNLVDPVFANPNSYSAAILWLAMFGYAVQIYADFSGYSNMAIGSARILGFQLPENFLFPYLATNFSEFWRRWHITMSTFFRDYIYIPLGGNRRTNPRVLVNLAVTMVLCGLWHGAAWTFVCWGGLHGIYLMARHLAPRISDKPRNGAQTYWHGAPLLWRWFVTQLLVSIAWVLFRSKDLDGARIFLTGLLGTGGGEGIYVPALVWCCFIAAFLDHLYGWFVQNRPELIEKLPAAVPALFYSGMIVFLYHAVPGVTNPFIYFRF